MFTNVHKIFTNCAQNTENALCVMPYVPPKCSQMFTNVHKMFTNVPKMLYHMAHMVSFFGFGWLVQLFGFKVWGSRVNAIPYGTHMYKGLRFRFRV